MEPPVQHQPPAAPVERVDRGAVTLLRPRGPLTRPALQQLHLAIQTEFAFGTRPIVCDLGDAATVDVGAVGLLHEAAQQCGGWPVVHLAYGGAQPEVARRLRRSGASRFLVLRDTVRLAERDVHMRPPKLRGRIELPPGLRSMVDARVFVGDCCLRWRLRDLIGPASDVTTDLLRVAASQPRGAAQLTVDWDGRTLGVVLLLRHAGALAPGTPLPPDVRVSHDEHGLAVSGSVVDDPAASAPPH